MFTRPSDVPVRAKKRFGQVGPGRDEKAVIADQELSGQAVEGRQEVERVITQNEFALPVQKGLRQLLVVLVGCNEVLDKAAIVILHLDSDVIDLVAGVKDHLALSGFGLRELVAVNVPIHIRTSGIDAIETPVHLLEAAEHLIEGMVLEH
jgi:hypothetical protein